MEKKRVVARPLPTRLGDMELKPNAYGRWSTAFGVLRTLGSIYSFVAAFALVGVFFYTFALVIIAMCSMFLLLILPSFRALFGQTDKAVALCIQLFYTLPIGVIVTLISSTCSSLLIRKDKNWVKAKGVRVRNIIAIVFSIICAIIFAVIYGLVKSGSLTLG